MGMRYAAAVLLAAAMEPASAADAAGKQFTVGVEDLQYYPLHTTQGGKTFGGFARDVFDAFAKQQGYTFRYVPLPINRLYMAFLKEQTVDFKYPDNPKWKEELRGTLKLTYSTAVVTSEEGAMVLPKNKGKPLERIKTLGTVLGFTPWPYLPAIARKSIVLTASDGFDGLLRHALAEHIDAVYINVDVANYQLADNLHMPGGLLFDPGLPHARSDFSLSTLRHPQVVDEFNAFLQREAATINKLRSKYKIASHEGQ